MESWLAISLGLELVVGRKTENKQSKTSITKYKQKLKTKQNNKTKQQNKTSITKYKNWKQKQNKTKYQNTKTKQQQKYLFNI